MITEMKKYTFLVITSAYERFLNELREAGVVHVTQKGEGMAEDETLQQALAKADELNRILKQGAPDQLLREKADVEAQISATRKEAERMRIWGEFSTERMQQLRDAGYTLRFYTCPKSAFMEEWGVPVAEAGATLYFVSVNTEADAEKCTEQTLNEKSYEALMRDVKAQQGLLVAAEARIEAWWTANEKQLREELQDTEQQIDWQKVKLSTDSAAEGRLSLLEGFCPVEQCEALNRRLEQLDCYYTAEDPAADDKTPIKLKNGFFARLFEPITRMYSLPNYMELDLTPFLAPFFMLFFGLCLGDGGYGLLLLAVGIVIVLKKPEFKEWGWLGIFMGGMTMIVGLLTGMFFGINLEQVAVLKPIKDYFITESNCTVHFAGGAYHPMMAFAIIIGIFQILFAMGLKVVRISISKGFKYAVYDLAWLVLLVTAIILLFVKDSLAAYGMYAIYAVLGLCALLILFYSNPDRKLLLLNIGGGLWGIYNMISGLLGDVLSYIRLFALGLAGGILGSVFNALALQVGEGMPSWIGWLPTLLIMLFGHGLNFALCLISSIVHPLRLTFVEFYKNAGFEGGGVDYEPFKHQNK